MVGILQHLSVFLSVSFFFLCVQIYASKKPFSASPNPCSQSIHQNHQLGWWKGAVNQMLSSFRWVAAGWQSHGCRRWLLKSVGKVLHFSCCVVFPVVVLCHSELSQPQRTPLLPWLPILDLKQPCCAKMQQEGPASQGRCRSHVHR